MKGNFETQEIEKAFEKINSDSLFKRSTLHTKILRYLIDQALAENDVKEQTIGVDLLKENYDNDQNDSKVRVYVYNLRKKLEEYYEGPGKDETLLFQIEKGQYNLVFKRKKIVVKKTLINKVVNIQFSLKKVLLITGFIVVFISLFLIGKSFKKQYLWEAFLQNNNSICVIADKFIVADKTVGNDHFALYPRINNATELEKYLETKPEPNLKPANFTMMSKMAPFGVHVLNRWFFKNNSDIELELESEIQLSDYVENNVIYIGQYKSMTTSKTLFLKNSKKFTAKMDGFIYSGKEGVKKFNSQIYKVEYKEYAMVSFQKLDNGNYSLFFVSNHDIGVLATLKMFTSEEKLKEFYKKLPHSNSEFNALFEVNGLKRNDFDCELVALEVME